MRTLNLGILAHVDAGKTSLTERLLYAAGVIDRIGSVDHGDTQTDSLALERQRGITIKAAVASFVIDGVTVNLVDTPGHPDFIAEVERVLNVLEGAVLVISAVEGVQAQTRVLMRTLQRLRLPTLIFVNKIDRRGAQYDPVLKAISERLTPAIVPMGQVHDLGARSSTFTPFGSGDAAFRTRLVELLTDRDEALLATYVGGETAPYRRLRDALAVQTRQGLVHPVFFGSAITGAGVDALIAGLTELLPVAAPNADGAVSGTVFKVERGQAGEKIAYVRVASGTLRTRERLPFGQERAAKVTAIRMFDQGSAKPCEALAAGRIGKLWGLSDVRIGDAIGASGTTAEGRYFAPPTLESVVVPRRARDRGAVHGALAQLAEQDPLINLRQDDVQQEMFVSLYGEVQKEVIQETLANDYGLDVEFRETTTICIERPLATGAAVETIYEPPNPFLATVGLRIEPAPPESGVRFQLDGQVFGTMPLAFFTAVEDAVHEALQQGLHGWTVTDCVVTMTHSGYAPRQSHAHQGFDKGMSSTGADFRSLTPLVVMAALKRSGVRVCEPMHSFRLDLPADNLAAVAPLLARLGAVQRTAAMRGASSEIEGEIPAARVHELQQRLPALTRGEGVLESAFDHYQPVRGPFPTRSRTDANPLDRREYLLRLKGRG